MLPGGNLMMHRFGFDAKRHQRLCHLSPQARGDHVGRLIEITRAVLRVRRDDAAFRIRLEEKELHFGAGGIDETPSLPPASTPWKGLRADPRGRVAHPG